MSEPIQWRLIRSDLLLDLLGEAEGAAANYHAGMRGYRQREHDRLDQLVIDARLALGTPEVPWAPEIGPLQQEIQRLRQALEAAHTECPACAWRTPTHQRSGAPA